MKEIILFIFFISFITSKIPNYVEIKRNETISFKLDNANSSFYAYLNWEEDYEIEEIEEEDYMPYHFFRLDKKIIFNQWYIVRGEDFPDESEFNKNNFSSLVSNPLDAYENIQAKNYDEFSADMKNRTSIFVFYLDDKYYDSFDKNETFTISRVKFNPYFNENIYNIELKPNDLEIYRVKMDENICTRHLIFLNTQFSVLYKDDLLYGYIKIQSNFNLYTYYDEDSEVFEELLLIIYNPNNNTRNINLEYYIQKKEIFYKSYDLNKFNGSTVYGDDKHLFYYFSGEPGPIKMKTNGENYIYSFEDNIEDIKNLKDLKNLEHYRHVSDGNFYISKKYFIFLITSSLPIWLTVDKINIEEKGQEINEFDFIYFKISQDNTLIFNSKYSKDYIILKLVSNNNGTVNIDNNIYDFYKGEIKLIEVEKEFEIKAINNNFTFAIKLKIPDEYIDYPDFGSKYNLPNNFNYKFLIYKIDVDNHSAIYFKIDPYLKSNYSYDLGNINVLEIEKREKSISVGYLNLINTKKYNLNDTIYLVLYLDNLTDNNITLETKYYNKIPWNDDIEFNPIKVQDFLSFDLEENKDIYFIIPCNSNIYFSKIGPNSFIFNEYVNPFRFSNIGELGYFTIISSRDDAFSFISYYKEDINEIDYSYFEEEPDIDLNKIPYFFDRFNETHLRFYIENLFSNAPEINYFFVITNYENKNLLEPNCEFFYNFYLNNYSKIDNLDLYNFSSINLKISLFNNSNYYYIDLPNPTKINLYERNKKFSFKLMGITGPKYKYVGFYPSFHLSMCYETCLECKSNGTEDNQNCISCIDGKLFQEDKGNCLDKCNIGYYQKENICKKCNENCKSCSGERENNNNKCLSCNKESKYKYLINHPDFGNNCVEICPNNTKLDEKKNQCIFIDKSDGNNKNKFLYIAIIVVSIILVLLLILFIFIKIRRTRSDKEKEKENIMKEMNYGILSDE